MRMRDPEKEVERPPASRAPTHNVYEELPASQNPHNSRTQRHTDDTVRLEHKTQDTKLQCNREEKCNVTSEVRIYIRNGSAPQTLQLI